MTDSRQIQIFRWTLGICQILAKIFQILAKIFQCGVGGNLPTDDGNLPTSGGNRAESGRFTSWRKSSNGWRKSSRFWRKMAKICAFGAPLNGCVQIDDTPPRWGMAESQAGREGGSRARARASSGREKRQSKILDFGFFISLLVLKYLFCVFSGRPRICFLSVCVCE